MMRQVTVDQWLKEVKAVTSAFLQSPPELLRLQKALDELFRYELNDGFVASLQNNLLDHNIDIEQVIEKSKFFKGNWPSFDALVKEYLIFCRDVDPLDECNTFELLESVFSLMVSCYSNAHGILLQRILKSAIRILVPLSMTLDDVYSADYKQPPRSSRIAFLLNNVSGTIRNDRKMVDPSATQHIQYNSIGESTKAEKLWSTKRGLLFYVTNRQFRIYMHNKTYNLFKPVLAAVNNTLKNSVDPSTVSSGRKSAGVQAKYNPMDLKYSEYCKSDMVEYRYSIGKYYLLEYNFSQAYGHLFTAFSEAANDVSSDVRISSTKRNIKRILRYLSICSIVKGILPKKETLMAFDLQDEIYPLVSSVRTGNFGLYVNHMIKYRDVFHKHEILIVIMNSIPLLIARSLIYQLAKFQLTVRGSNELPYDLIEYGISFSLAAGSGLSCSTDKAFGTSMNELTIQYLNMFRTYLEGLHIPDYSLPLELNLLPMSGLLLQDLRDSRTKEAENYDDLEIEGLCSNLISQGFVRGFLYIKRRMVGLSRTDPVLNVSKLFDKKFAKGFPEEEWMNH